MSPGAIFDRVYLDLRDQLRAGRFRPGDHLEPALLSHDLNASITPVRDALHRLVGERLVEAPRGDGFRAPYLTEVGLRHLYAWSSRLLLLAAATPGATLPRHVVAPRLLAPDDPPPRIAAVAAEIFLGVAQLAANPEHVAAIAAVVERLAPVRLVEAALLCDMIAEVNRLGEALLEAPVDKPLLRRTLAAYHRRRTRLAPDIVVALAPSA